MQKKSADRFSVLTLNLRFGKADDGPNSWQYRETIFPDFFKRYQPDFIGLQEVNAFQADYMAAILPEYRLAGRRKPAPDFWQDDIILYKKSWACIRCDHFFLSATPDIPSRLRQSRWPRQCVIGLFRQKAKRLACVNTHFDFKPSVQNKSARLIMSRLSHLPDSTDTILMGDFNATPDTACYKLFTERGSSLFKNAFKKPFPGTHHGFTGRANGGHIDWILYRGGIKPVKAKRIRDTISGFYPSDHFPLIAEFSWNDA